MNSSNELLIIGAGYCGEKLRKKLHCPATRTPEKALTNTHISFDYRNAEDYKNLPAATSVLISIPPPAKDKQEDFSAFITLLELCKEKYSRLLLFSTTSVYLQSQENETINEQTRLDEGHPRFAAEQKAMELGFTIITLCGIWGPLRTPLSWIRKRIIRDKDSSVNLIHVDDICTLTQQLAESKEPLPARINFSSGRSHQWQDIATNAGLSLEPPVTPPRRRPRKFTHKCIDNSLLLQLCGKYQFREDFNSET